MVQRARKRGNWLEKIEEEEEEGDEKRDLCRGRE